MPVAEKAEGIPGGEYGSDTAEANFVASTTPDAQPPTIYPPENIQPPNDLPPPEPDEANPLDLGEEGAIDLGEMLTGPSERPDEPVTAGLPGSQQVAKVSQVLSDLAAQFPSADLAALAGLARSLDV